jgi:predicted dehydrogenase
MHAINSRVRDEGMEETHRTLRVALVGCGWFAVRAHLPALQKLERTSPKALGFQVSLYALCSRTQANVERASKRLDKHKQADVKLFLDLDAVLADPLVDGPCMCLLCSQPLCHAQQQSGGGF